MTEMSQRKNNPMLEQKSAIYCHVLALCSLDLIEETWKSRAYPFYHSPLLPAGGTPEIDMLKIFWGRGPWLHL